MLIPPGMKCVNCGKLIVEGDAIIITNTGSVQKVGGLGLMKNALTFRGSERVEHASECALPKRF